MRGEFNRGYKALGILLVVIVTVGVLAMPEVQSIRKQQKNVEALDVPMIEEAQNGTTLLIESKNVADWQPYIGKILAADIPNLGLVQGQVITDKVVKQLRHSDIKFTVINERVLGQAEIDQEYLEQLWKDAGVKAPDNDVPVWADKSRDFQLPVTRGSLASIFGTAYHLGLLDQWVNEDIVQVTLSSVNNDYGKAAIEGLSLTKLVTRGEWAHLAMTWKNVMQIPDYGCCVGDNPDFTDLSEDYIYYEDVKAAALAGLLCTSTGTRVDEYLTVEEMNKYIWKVISEHDEGVYNSTSNYTAYETVEEFMEAMTKEPKDEELPRVYEDMLFVNYKAGVLPVDYLGRMNLERQVTVKDIITLLIGMTDMHLVYAKLEESGGTCVPCSFLGVEGYYTPYVTAFDND